MQRLVVFYAFSLVDFLWGAFLCICVHLCASWIFFGVHFCAFVCTYVHSCVECMILRICILVQCVVMVFKDSKLKLLF